MPSKPRPSPRQAIKVRRRATPKPPALHEGAEGWVRVRVEKVIEGPLGPRAAVSVKGYGLSRLTMDPDDIELEPVGPAD